MLPPEGFGDFAFDIRAGQTDVVEHAVVEAGQGCTLPATLMAGGDDFREANEHSGKGQPLAGGRS
jgi:hypothetical protein